MASKQSVPTVPPANPTGNAVQNNVPLLNWRTCSSRNVLVAAGMVAGTEPLNNTVDGLNQLPDAAGALSKRKQHTHQEIQANALVNEAARQAKGRNALAGAGMSAGTEPLSNTVDGLNQLPEAARQAKADARAATTAAKATEKQAKVDVKAAKANTQTAKSKKTVAQLTVLHKPVNVPIQTPCPTNNAFSLHEACQH